MYNGKELLFCILKEAQKSFPKCHSIVRVTVIAFRKQEILPFLTSPFTLGIDFVTQLVSNDEKPSQNGVCYSAAWHRRKKM